MKKLLIAAGVVVVLLGGAGFAGWYFFIRSEAPPPAKIKQTKVHEGGTLAGTYILSSGDPQSFVGYRVQEQFAAATIESTAAGRTSTLQGSLAIAGMRIDTVGVTADMRTLRSDKDLRDSRMHTIGLQSDTFPQSKFALTKPIRFDRAPAAGKTVKATATGDLTLHGVTKRVDVPVEGRWDGRAIQVVGHLPIQFADYKIDPPNIAGFTSVQDHGEMEFQLFFRKR
jgi:polyisoprenoid-binding protein YceI